LAVAFLAGVLSVFRVGGPLSVATGVASAVRDIERRVISISVDAPSATSAVGGTTAAVETVTTVVVRGLSGQGRCWAPAVMEEAAPEPIRVTARPAGDAGLVPLRSRPIPARPAAVTTASSSGSISHGG
jgi:hypothetical protein